MATEPEDLSRIIYAENPHPYSGRTLVPVVISPVLECTTEKLPERITEEYRGR